MRVIDDTVFFTGDNWDEWASAAYFCIELPELLHQGHSSVQDSHTQHVRRHSTRYEKCSHAHYIAFWVETIEMIDWLSFPPAVVEYKIADMGHVKYYLAPKIDEESS